MTDDVREVAMRAITAAEQAQRHAHDPARWQEVCGHLADARRALADLRRIVEPEGGHEPDRPGDDVPGDHPTLFGGGTP